MADVFISYSRRDGEVVRDLYGFLSGAGRDVWVDWEDIPPASDWQQDIYDSIDAAHSLVFIVTANSLESEYCLLELKHAQERGKRIVPFACDGADPNGAPEGLRQLNWIWCRATDDRDAALAKLMSALDTDLDWSRAHTRLLVRAVEWDSRRDSSLLLRGRDLKAVERELMAHTGQEPVPTELQQRYVDASRRGAARRQRMVLGSVLLALAISVALAVAALLQRNDARHATRKATSVALAATATNRLASNLDQSLLLGLAAYRTNPTPQARDAMVSALESARSLEVDQFLHTDTNITSVAVAPDERTAVTGDAKGTVNLWDIRDRTLVGTLPGTSAIVSVGFTRDGSTLVAAHRDGTVQLWDVAARRPRAEPFRAGGTIASGAVSPDGRFVAAGTGLEDARVWLWNVADRRLRRLAAPGDTVDQLVFSPDSGTLVAGANSFPSHVVYGSVRLWDSTSGKKIGEPRVTGEVDALAFAPGGRRFATAGHYAGGFTPSRGVIQLWDPRQLRAPVATIVGGPNVGGIAFGPDGRTLAVGQATGTIRLHKGDGLKPSGPPLHGLEGMSLAFSRDGHTIIGVAVGGARVWDLRDRGSFGRALSRGRGPQQLMSVAFSPDGRIVAAGDGYGMVRLANLATGTPLRPLRFAANGDTGVESVAFSADGRTLAAGDDAVQLWNVHTRRPLDRLPPRGGIGGTALAFDESGTILADAGSRGLRFWNVPERRLLNKTFVPVDTVAFIGPETVATSTDNATIRTWTVNRVTPDGPPRRPVDAFTARVAFSPDGRTVAIGDASTNVWLWDRRGSRPLTQLPGGVGNQVNGLAFSPDGRTLIVAAHGMTLWDANTGTPLGRALHPQGYVASVAVSPDGRTLVSAGDALRVWKGILWHDLSDLERQVCGLVIGGLTRAEWAGIAAGLPYTRTC